MRKEEGSDHKEERNLLSVLHKEVICTAYHTIRTNPTPVEGRRRNTSTASVYLIVGKFQGGHFSQVSCTTGKLRNYHLRNKHVGTWSIC